ncbi:MAG: Flp family type IVb pilin [Terracidiphilus sp.]|jgi:Flp pilus assembly pilin Flp
MSKVLLKLYLLLQDLKNREDGQDLAEYALTVAMIGFSAVAGMHSLAAGINTAFTTINTTFSSNL